MVSAPPCGIKTLSSLGAGRGDGAQEVRCEGREAQESSSRRPGVPPSSGCKREARPVVCLPLRTLTALACGARALRTGTGVLWQNGPRQHMIS